MVSETFDHVVVAIGMATTAVFGLAIAIAIPYVFVSTTPPDLAGSDAAAARYALVQVENTGGVAQRAARLRSSVVWVEPDPSGCEWGYPGAIAAIVTVKSFSLFGVPIETWTVDCHGPHKTWSLP